MSWLNFDILDVGPSILIFEQWTLLMECKKIKEKLTNDFELIWWLWLLHMSNNPITHALSMRNFLWIVNTLINHIVHFIVVKYLAYYAYAKYSKSILPWRKLRIHILKIKNVEYVVMMWCMWREKTPKLQVHNACTRFLINKKKLYSTFWYNVVNFTFKRKTFGSNVV